MIKKCLKDNLAEINGREDFKLRVCWSVRVMRNGGYIHLARVGEENRGRRAAKCEILASWGNERKFAEKGNFREVCGVLQIHREH